MLKWDDFLLNTMKTIGSGTEPDEEKSYMILDDITNLSYDHEYDELTTQIMLKEKYGCY